MSRYIVKLLRLEKCSEKCDYWAVYWDSHDECIPACAHPLACTGSKSYPYPEIKFREGEFPDICPLPQEPSLDCQIEVEP